MALAEHPLAGFAHGGEGRNQDVVERLALRQLLLEIRGPGAQFVVAQLGEFGLERVDRMDTRLVALDPPVIGGAEQLAGDCAKHTKSFSSERLWSDDWNRVLVGGLDWR